MMYRFKCQATGDVLMMGPHGDHLLHLLGREPAPRGIIEPAHMPAVIATLQAAIEADDAARAQAQEAAAAQDEAPDPQALSAAPPVGLRQRLWPMLDMLRQAHAEGKPVVWGV
jgi:hypothetical protein